MKAMLKGLVQHLRNNSYRIVRSETVQTKYYDPTYGLREGTVEIQTVDFDRLLQEIDDFAEKFHDE